MERHPRAAVAFPTALALGVGALSATVQDPLPVTFHDRTHQTSAASLPSVETMLEVPAFDPLSISNALTDTLKYNKLFKPFPGFVPTAHLVDSAYKSPRVASLTFDEALAQSNAYASQFGVTIEPLACTPRPTLAYHAGCLSTEQKESFAVKSNLETVTSALSSQPMALPRQIGWNKVIFTGHLRSDTPNSFGIGGFAVDNTTMVLDAINTFPPTSITHEESHLLDYKSAGLPGIREVPTFASLNQKSSYLNTFSVDPSYYAGQPVTRRALFDNPQMKMLEHEQYAAMKSGRMQEARNLTVEINELNTAAEEVSDYALVNEQEDFAESGAQMLLGYPSGLVESPSPVLHAKAIAFLERLRLVSSATVDYLAYRVRRDKIQQMSYFSGYSMK